MVYAQYYVVCMNQKKHANPYAKPYPIQSDLINYRFKQWPYIQTHIELLSLSSGMTFHTKAPSPSEVQQVEWRLRISPLPEFQV